MFVDTLCSIIFEIRGFNHRLIDPVLFSFFFDVYFRVQCFFPTDTRQLSNGKPFRRRDCRFLCIYGWVCYLNTALGAGEHLERAWSVLWLCVVTFSRNGYLFYREKWLIPPPVARAADGLVHIQECCARPASLHTSSYLHFKNNELII